MRLVPRIGIHAVQGDGFGWPVTLPAYDGKACPDCGAIVIGANHRAQHRTLHDRLTALEDALHQAAAALSVMAAALEREGMVTVLDGGGEDQEEEPVMSGYVIGAGQLPAETRGGDDL